VLLPDGQTINETNFCEIVVIQYCPSLCRARPIACLEEPIGHMHKGQWAQGTICTGRWRVVERECLNDRLWQSPEAEQICPDFGMRRPEHDVLRVPVCESLCLHAL
jgi:formate dehydrogenase maturation protein FdhE